MPTRPRRLTADYPATVDLPLQTRADVRLMPESVDAERRTVELVWSTGAAVRRRDPWTGKRYDEVLSLEETHVDLSRLNGGAPLLNTHGAWDLRDVIGVVERAWIAREGEALVGRATVRFSDRADVEPIWRDVASGIVRNVSVGYAVRSYEITETDGQPPVWRAVDWQPLELSAVPIGADAAAGFRAAGQPGSADRARHPSLPSPAPHPGAHPRGADHDPRSRDRDHAAGGRRCGRARGHAPAEPTPAPEARAAAEAPQTRAVAPTAEPAAAPAARRRRARPRCRPRPSAPGPRSGTASPRSTTRRASSASPARSPTISSPAATGVDAARAALIDAAAARDAQAETRPHVRMGGLDAGETRRAAVEAALLHRYDPGRFALSRARARVARPVADRDGPRLARGGGGAGPRPQPRRDRHPGAALDLGLPGDPRRRHQQDAARRLRHRAADLSGDRPAHHRRRLQAGAPAAARRGAAAREGQPVRRVQARHHRRGAGDLPHRDLRQGDRHHPPGADQRRPRRLHPGAGALRHLGGDAGERRRLGHLHRQPGDGRRQRRSSTPATRTSPAPARRSTSPGSPRRAPPWRSSAGSTARRC